MRRPDRHGLFKRGFDVVAGEPPMRVDFSKRMNGNLLTAVVIYAVFLLVGFGALAGYIGGAVIRMMGWGVTK
jgi:hypothetical protein